MVGKNITVCLLLLIFAIAMKAEDRTMPGQRDMAASGHGQAYTQTQTGPPREVSECGWWN